MSCRKYLGNDFEKRWIFSRWQNVINNSADDDDDDDYDERISYRCLKS